MKVAEGIALLSVGLVCFFLGGHLVVVDAPPRPDLKRQIDALYERAVAQCHQHRAGDESCVKEQFFALYRWEVLLEHNRLVGPPGIPGPRGR